MEFKEGATMRTIKVNVRNERARYNALMDAMVSQEEVEGGYVMLCIESHEQGERIWEFLLRPSESYQRQGNLEWSG